MGIATHKRDEQISINDFVHTNAMIKRAMRTDERALNAVRALKVEVMNEGNCLVTIGKRVDEDEDDGNKCGDHRTIAHARCTAELSKPRSRIGQRSSEGTVQFRVRASAMAHPLVDSFKTNDCNDLLEQDIEKMLEKTYRDARAIDLESLCVCAGRYCWQIKVEIEILNYGGDVQLACSVAALSALKSFRRPECAVNQETNVVEFHEEREGVSLQLMHHPVAIRFAVFDPRNAKGSGFDGDDDDDDDEDNNNDGRDRKNSNRGGRDNDSRYIMVADATALEEACAIGFATVAVNEHGETCYSTLDFLGERLGKSTTRGADVNCLLELHKTASDLAKTICANIKKTHEIYEEKRLEGKTRRRRYDPEALEKAAQRALMKENDEDEENDEDDALIDDTEAMDEEGRASEDSTSSSEEEDGENDWKQQQKQHVPLVSLKPPASSSSSSDDEDGVDEDGVDGEEDDEDEDDDDIDELFRKAEKKHDKKRTKLAAKTWDAALPGSGNNLSETVKPKKKATLKAKKKLTRKK